MGGEKASDQRGPLVASRDLIAYSDEKEDSSNENNTTATNVLVERVGKPAPQACTGNVRGGINHTNEPRVLFSIRCASSVRDAELLRERLVAGMN